jgi:hypothetical protein
MLETRTHVQDGCLPRPIHRLQYLDLAFPNDDTSLLVSLFLLHNHHNSYAKLARLPRYPLPCDI